MKHICCVALLKAIKLKEWLNVHITESEIVVPFIVFYLTCQLTKTNFSNITVRPLRLDGQNTYTRQDP